MKTYETLEQVAADPHATLSIAAIEIAQRKKWFDDNESGFYRDSLTNNYLTKHQLNRRQRLNNRFIDLYLAATSLDIRTNP